MNINISTEWMFWNDPKYMQTCDLVYTEIH